MTARPNPLIASVVLLPISTPAPCEVAVLLLLFRVKSSARSVTTGINPPITSAGLSTRYLLVSSPNQARPDSPGCDAF